MTTKRSTRDSQTAGSTESSDAHIDVRGVVVSGMAGGFEAKVVRADKCLFQIEADPSEFTREELDAFEHQVTEIASRMQSETRSLVLVP